MCYRLMVNLVYYDLFVVVGLPFIMSREIENYYFI
jgi:hypothetical protein